jgi:hypothetical protein
MFPKWKGAAAVVVACGPSAKELSVSLNEFHGKIVVVNRAWELLPGADLLYAADSGFWMTQQKAHAFKGLKFAPEKRCKEYCPSVQLVEIPNEKGRRVERLIFEPIGRIGAGGGNSGFQAVNLTMQFGANPIYLVGVDYCGEHWHGPHVRPLRNPSGQQFSKWRKYFDDAAEDFKAHGVEVINLSDVSTLENYKKCSIHEVIKS